MTTTEATAPTPPPKDFLLVPTLCHPSAAAPNPMCRTDSGIDMPVDSIPQLLTPSTTAPVAPVPINLSKPALPDFTSCLSSSPSKVLLQRDEQGDDSASTIVGTLERIASSKDVLDLEETLSQRSSPPSLRRRSSGSFTSEEEGPTEHSLPPTPETTFTAPTETVSVPAPSDTTTPTSSSSAPITITPASPVEPPSLYIATEEDTTDDDPSNIGTPSSSYSSYSSANLYYHSNQSFTYGSDGGGGGGWQSLDRHYGRNPSRASMWSEINGTYPTLSRSRSLIVPLPKNASTLSLPTQLNNTDSTNYETDAPSSSLSSPSQTPSRKRVSFADVVVYLDHEDWANRLEELRRIRTEKEKVGGITGAMGRLIKRGVRRVGSVVGGLRNRSGLNKSFPTRWEKDMRFDDSDEDEEDDYE
ncbi:hypothetical protein HK102_003484 [Quaeritorhiza haematococci]|nr:hypothetical protein HK102_003484 [Quaeritorhiza haematococci]